MSRKTMDEYPDLFNICPPPPTMHPQNDDTRAQDLIDHRLNDTTVSRAYKEPWNTHLTDGTDSFKDSIWGVTEGKKDIRNLKRLPEDKY